DWTHMAFDVGASVPNVIGKYGASGATVAARQIGSSLEEGLVDARLDHAMESSSDTLADALYLIRLAGPESRLALEEVRGWNKEISKQKPRPATTEWYHGLDALLGSKTTDSLRSTATVDQEALVLQHQ